MTLQEAIALIEKEERNARGLGRMTYDPESYASHYGRADGLLRALDILRKVDEPDDKTMVGDIESILDDSETTVGYEDESHIMPINSVSVSEAVPRIVAYIKRLQKVDEALAEVE